MFKFKTVVAEFKYKYVPQAYFFDESRTGCDWTLTNYSATEYAKNLINIKIPQTPKVFQYIKHKIQPIILMPK